MSILRTFQALLSCWPRSTKADRTYAYGPLQDFELVDFDDIGLYEYLEGDNVVIIEWPEVIDNVLASLDRLCVRISAGADPSETYV